ncbi:MAG: hypothetical protein AAGA75_12070 [Cyanobacteria bacterium P01_E01_bin.6]
MFNVTCIDQDLEHKLSNALDYFSGEACIELEYFLKALQQYGEISRTNFFLGNINCISATSVCVYYLSKPDAAEVVLLDVIEKNRDAKVTSLSSVEEWDDQTVIDCIPQYDKPAKIIRAVECIHDGVRSALDLGTELGHRAEKPKDVARQGHYALKTLDALNLVELRKSGRQSIPVLTERGDRIAQAQDHETKEALLIAAMLNYAPVMMVIEAVTKGGRRLDDRLIKDLVFPVEFRSADTCNRRAQTIKSWVKWICHYQLLPMAVDDGATQLPLPMLFST